MTVLIPTYAHSMIFNLSAANYAYGGDSTVILV